MSEPIAPRCPKCGSRDVREWDLVPMPYYGVTLTVHDDGSVGVDATDDGGEPAYDAGRFDSLMCRDCDYESSEPADFLPQPSVERGSG